MCSRLSIRSWLTVNLHHSSCIDHHGFRGNLPPAFDRDLQEPCFKSAILPDWGIEGGGFLNSFIDVTDCYIRSTPASQCHLCNVKKRLKIYGRIRELVSYKNDAIFHILNWMFLWSLFLPFWMIFGMPKDLMLSSWEPRNIHAKPGRGALMREERRMEGKWNNGKSSGEPCCYLQFICTRRRHCYLPLPPLSFQTLVTVRPNFCV